MSDKSEAYKDLAVGLLEKFQLLEFGIKVYIAISYKSIRNLLDGKMYFAYSEADIANYPLERLLAIFGKLIGNDDLKSRLNKLRKLRNDVAH